MKILRIPYDWFAFYLSLLLLGSIQLAWAFIAFVIRQLVTHARGRVIGRRFISGLYRNFFRWTEALGILVVDARALDAIDQRQPMIIAPNHPSVLDALILISRLDNLNCIMKASVLDNILLGAGARLAAYIRNDAPKSMLRLAAADLKQGGQVIIFPEGTRTVAAPVNDFKFGFAAIAKSAGVPVQTVIIETDTPFLAKGWPVLKKPARFPMKFRVRLGESFEVGEDVNAFVQDLRGYFVHELAGAELGDLRQAARDEPAGLARPALAKDKGITAAALARTSDVLRVHGTDAQP
ncbi:MAG: lysophospholipid acyltransferase family protein [Burkholderiaceae bacterium]